VVPIPPRLARKRPLPPGVVADAVWAGHTFELDGQQVRSDRLRLRWWFEADLFAGDGVDRFAVIVTAPGDDCDWYVFAATYNALGKPTEIQLGNGLSQRTNYFGVDTPTWFGPGQFGRMRQICVVATGAGNCAPSWRRPW